MLAQTEDRPSSPSDMAIYKKVLTILTEQDTCEGYTIETHVHTYTFRYGHIQESYRPIETPTHGLTMQFPFA